MPGGLAIEKRFGVMNLETWAGIGGGYREIHKHPHFRALIQIEVLPWLLAPESMQCAIFGLWVLGCSLSGVTDR